MRFALAGLLSMESISDRFVLSLISSLVTDWAGHSVRKCRTFSSSWGHTWHFSSGWCLKRNRCWFRAHFPTRSFEIKISLLLWGTLELVLCRHEFLYGLVVLAKESSSAWFLIKTLGKDGGSSSHKGFAVDHWSCMPMTKFIARLLKLGKCAGAEVLQWPRASLCCVRVLLQYLCDTCTIQTCSTCNVNL